MKNLLFFNYNTIILKLKLKNKLYLKIKIKSIFFILIKYFFMKN